MVFDNKAYCDFDYRAVIVDDTEDDARMVGYS